MHSKAAYFDPSVLFVDNAQIQIFKNVKDLGVTIDNHLSFTDHISRVISQANQRILSYFQNV